MMNRKVALVGLAGALVLAGAVAACSSGDTATTAQDPDGGGGVDSGGSVDSGGGVDTGTHVDSGGGVDSGADTAVADTGPVPDAIADAAPLWTPATLGTSLALWLNGDVGVTTVNCTTNQCVSSWADQSANHNNATQATAAAQPIYDLAKYNGHNAIKYDGSTTTLMVPDATSLQFSNGYTIIAVAANGVTAAPHTGALFSKQVAGYPFAGPSLWLNYANTGGVTQMGQTGTQTDYTKFVATTSTALDDNALRAYEARWDPNTATNNLSLRINNGTPVTVTATMAAGAINAAGADLTIGGKPTSGQVVLGEIAEIIAINTPISDADWASAYAYLKAKYNLP